MNIISKIGIKNKILIWSIFIVIKKLPSKDIRRCPAIKFAVNRTHKVIGRIKLLTSSIITINIIKALGVPWGTKWDSMWFVFLVQPNNINDNQNVKDKGKVTVIWEVGEKICGYKARKFIVIIIKKVSIIMFSLLFSFLFKVKETSFLNVLFIFLNKTMS